MKKRGRPPKVKLTVTDGQPQEVASVTVADPPGDPNYRYPDFKPAREPLPAGVVYATVRRELFNSLQKEVQLEGGEYAILWLAWKEAEALKKRYGRLIGVNVPVEVNPDERQGGYRIWKR